ncbi:MAG TPA: alpha/beta fold hydrolase [Candidatus Eisenbacteria bacterium]|nr:alpha/beta fold hydrolase [Candidatus Eisenbacteria bacterium]
MTNKGGRLELLVPHLLRGQLLRPRFVRMSLRLGAARQMPRWAKLQFINSGVSPEDLDLVLGHVTSLESWVDEWEKLGQQHEQGGRAELAFGHAHEAALRFLAASAAFNFAQYVVFIDLARKRELHEACVRCYAEAAPLLDPPAQPFEVSFRRRMMKGWLRVPRGNRLAPVVVLFHGTNAVKEELHWWSEALLERGLATITFDGPGLGETFHRLSMLAEPRPVGTAILNQIEARPELDPNAVAFIGFSLGGYLVIRMASHDPRIKAVGAVSPPFSLDIYWNVTLAGMRRELAALYGTSEQEMGAVVNKITLADVIGDVRCPMLVAGGGHDLLTPGEEAWRIFEQARCERELLFYPRAGHDCFNVLSDLRPRMAGWLARQLEPHRDAAPRRRAAAGAELTEAWRAAEAVDPDFADELCGAVHRLVWNAQSQTAPVHYRWWNQPSGHIEMVHRTAHAETPAAPRPVAPPRELAGDIAG